MRTSLQPTATAAAISGHRLAMLASLAMAACGPTTAKTAEGVCADCLAPDASLDPDAVPGVPDATLAALETCNGLDDDGNGLVDESCPCELGTSQPCYPGGGAEVGVGICTTGVQSCARRDEFYLWSSCEGAILPEVESCDGQDNDCNGVVDDLPGGEHCQVECMNVEIDGDCVTVTCPAEVPYPFACDIIMDGGDERGCVASSPTGSTVYFQEGDRCGAGHVTGTLCCRTIVGPGLDADNCVINKSAPSYPADSSGCPRAFF